VPDAPLAHVHIAFEVGAEPIAGRIECDGASRPFVGWIELGRVIALVLDAAARPRERGSPTTRSP
jgi:hypothetical protein